MVLEVLDTPKTRRERYMQRKKGSKGDKSNVAGGSSSRAGPSSVRSLASVAGPSHLRVSMLAVGDPEVESELSALSDLEDDGSEESKEPEFEATEGSPPVEEFEQVGASEPEEGAELVVKFVVAEASPPVEETEPREGHGQTSEADHPSEGHDPTVDSEPLKGLALDEEPASGKGATPMEEPTPPRVEPDVESSPEEEAQPKDEEADVEIVPTEQTESKSRTRRSSGKRTGKGKGKGRVNARRQGDATAGTRQSSGDGIITLEKGKYLDGGTLGVLISVLYV